MLKPHALLPHGRILIQGARLKASRRAIIIISGYTPRGVAGTEGERLGVASESVPSWRSGAAVQCVGTNTDPKCTLYSHGDPQEEQLWC